MHKIDWFVVGLQLAYISSKNVGENDLTPRIKYVMVILDTEPFYKMGDRTQDILWNKSSV